MLDFHGSTVLVVGGSSGIGNGIARAFLEHGAIVHVWGSRATASDYADEPGSHLEGLLYEQVDVSDCARVQSYAPPFSALHVLVLCQGAMVHDGGEYQPQAFEQVVQLNLHSVMHCCLRFRGLLSDSRGALITVSSTTAYHATVGHPAYNASKTGIVGLTRSLGAAWAREGIRVNGIAPGLVDTKLTRRLTRDPPQLAALLQKIPVGRVGTPAEMGGVALFLASSAAQYIIGQTIVVDGGLLLL